MYPCFLRGFFWEYIYIILNDCFLFILLLRYLNHLCLRNSITLCLFTSCLNSTFYSKVKTLPLCPQFDFSFLNREKTLVSENQDMSEAWYINSTSIEIFVLPLYVFCYWNNFNLNYFSFILSKNFEKPSISATSTHTTSRRRLKGFFNRCR